MKESGSKSNGDYKITESDIENEYIRETMMGDEANNATFLERATIEIKRSFWPRRCHFSKKLIWLTNGIRARNTYHGLAGEDLVYEDRWYEPMAFTFVSLGVTSRYN
jgi:hypothetical protein